MAVFLTDIYALYLCSIGKLSFIAELIFNNSNAKHDLQKVNEQTSLGTRLLIVDINVPISLLKIYI